MRFVLAQSAQLSLKLREVSSPSGFQLIPWVIFSIYPGRAGSRHGTYPAPVSSPRLAWKWQWPMSGLLDKEAGNAHSSLRREGCVWERAVGSVSTCEVVKWHRVCPRPVFRFTLPLKHVTCTIAQCVEVSFSGNDAGLAVRISVLLWVPLRMHTSSSAGDGLSHQQGPVLSGDKAPWKTFKTCTLCEN